MKEAIVSPELRVEIIDSPVPEPGSHQVLIKVHVSGMNPKDWKVPFWTKTSQNSGDDIAGIVSAVGADVVEFKVGDRVAAFHEMVQPHGSFAEYAIAFDHTTFHLPKNISFAEGATVPLAAMTGAMGLFYSLGLPQPWTPASTPLPLVIYGATSAVGLFAVKLAIQANIHPLICVAGRAADRLRSTPGFDESKGDTVVDYRGNVAADLEEALDNLGVRKLEYAFDVVSDHGSDEHLAQVLALGARVTTILPDKEHPTLKGFSHVITNVGKSHGEGKDFAKVFYRHFSRSLGNGTLTAHPFENRMGLEAIESGLKDLKDGKASAVKYVFTIVDETQA